MEKLEDQEKGYKCVRMYKIIREKKLNIKLWTLSAPFFKGN